MKKAYEYLLIGIFTMTALLVAAVGLKMYSGYMDEQEMQAEADRLRLEEIMARNTEAHNRVMEMESEIASMIEDVESLQTFIDHAVEIANEVQNRKKLENQQEEVPVMSESVSDDTAVSGNENFGGETTVSGNESDPDGMAVSGNEMSLEGVTVSGNVFVLDGADTPEEAVALSGMTVSGNTIVFGDAVISEDSVVSNGVTVSGNMAVPNEWAVSGKMLLSDGMTIWGNLILSDTEADDESVINTDSMTSDESAMNTDSMAGDESIINSDSMAGDGDAVSADGNAIYYSGEMTVSGNTIVLKDLIIPEDGAQTVDGTQPESEAQVAAGAQPENAAQTVDGVQPESEAQTADGTQPENDALSSGGADEMTASDNATASGNITVSGVILLIGDAVVSGDFILSEDMTVSGNLLVPIDRGDAAGMENGDPDGWGYNDGQEEMSLEERKALRSSYQETLEVNQKDKEWIAGNEYDFSEMKIACLGDSLTAAANLEGEENYEQYTYPTKLQQLLGAQEVYNLGIGGSSIGRYWADAFVERYTAIPQDTDIIIVMGGTNDGFCVSDDEFGNLDERTYRTFCGDLNELMGGLRANYPDATIFFATPLPNVLQDYLMGEREYLLPQRDFVEVIKTLADEYDFEVVDLYNSNILDSHDAKVIAEYMPDGVHGNPDGYQVIAEHFASEIVQHYQEDRISQESDNDAAMEEAGNVQEGTAASTSAGSTGSGNTSIGNGSNAGAGLGTNSAAIDGSSTAAGAGTGGAGADGSGAAAGAGTGGAEASGSSTAAGAGMGGAEANGSGAGVGTGPSSGIDIGAVTDKGNVSTGIPEESGTDSGSGKSRYGY